MESWEIFDFRVEDPSLFGMLNKINSFTDVGQGGILGIFILLVVGGSLILIMRERGNERAFPVAALVTSIIGVLLRIINWINDTIFWVCVALFVVGVIYLIKEQGQYE